MTVVSSNYRVTRIHDSGLATSDFFDGANAAENAMSLFMSLTEKPNLQYALIVRIDRDETHAYSYETLAFWDKTNDDDEGLPPIDIPDA